MAAKSEPKSPGATSADLVAGFCQGLHGSHETSIRALPAFLISPSTGAPSTPLVCVGW